MQDAATTLRLACARAMLWFGWELATFGLKMFVRPDHPTRVYLEGGRCTARKTQMDALRFATGPRFRPGTYYKVAVLGLLPIATLLPPLYELV